MLFRREDRKIKPVNIPEELPDLLQQPRWGSRFGADQVKTALAIHLLLEGLISIGKAAEPRVDFEWLLVQMGRPTVRYDLADYEQDQLGIAEAEQHHHAS